MIQEVKSWRDKNQFVKLPADIYSDAKNYCITPFALQKSFLSDRHPFLKHGQRALFMAKRNGIVAARAMVSLDPRSTELHQENVACIGQFEAIDDGESGLEVLAACQEWAMKNSAVTSLRGPIDFSLNYPIGMFIGPHDSSHTVMMNYHKPYYPKIWEAFGFQKKIDLFSWWGKSPEKIDRWVEKVRRIGSNSEIKITSLTKKNFKQELFAAEGFISRVLQGHVGYVPMTAAEFKLFVKELQFVPPELIMVAKLNEKLVGISFTLPDFNEILRPLEGKLFTWGLPIGSIQFYRNIKNIRTARFAFLGVDPEYRFEGIAERMIIESLHVGREKFNFNAAELGWTSEDNIAMVNNIEKLGLDLKKTYRIYEKSLNASSRILH